MKCCLNFLDNNWNSAACVNYSSWFDGWYFGNGKGRRLLKLVARCGDTISYFIFHICGDSRRLVPVPWSPFASRNSWSQFVIVVAVVHQIGVWLTDGSGPKRINSSVRWWTIRQVALVSSCTSSCCHLYIEKSSTYWETLALLYLNFLFRCVCRFDALITASPSGAAIAHGLPWNRRPTGYSFQFPTLAWRPSENGNLLTFKSIQNGIQTWPF